MDAYQDLAVSPLQPRVAPGGGAAVESADGDDGTGLSDGPGRGLEDILLSPPSGQAEQLDDNDSPSGSSLDDSPAGVHVSSRGPGRGRHTRTAGMSKRRSWRTVIHEHMHSLPRLLTTSSCSPSCRGCDPASWVTLGLLLSCACTSFGEVVQDVNWQEPYDWDQVQRKMTRNHAATANWFELVYAMKTIDPESGCTSIDYRLQGRAVCRGIWQKFHGVPAKTMDTIIRLVEQGEVEWSSRVRTMVRSAHLHERASLHTAAEQWWYLRLDYYEIIVDSRKGSGVIQHPHNVDWRIVYDTEFVPEMRSIGYDWKDFTKSSGTTGSIATWYGGRAAALASLAIDRIGPDAAPFKFQSRAKHSAYVRVSHRKHQCVLVCVSMC